MAPTTGPRTAAGIARQSIREGADLIVGMGGDGTINEVAEGVIHTDAALAILPAGTANVLATETCMGDDLLRAAAGLSELVPRRIGVGRLCTGSESRHFLLMAGIGLDAHIIYELSAALKARFGKIAYWLTGFRQLGRPFEEFEVEVNGERILCSFALVSRVRNYGGDLQIACSTTLLDEQFEIVLFEGTSSLRYLKYLAGAALRRLTNMRGVRVLRAERLSVRPGQSTRVYVQIDGEFAGRLPVTIEMLPRSLTLLLPPAYAETISDSA